MLQAERGAATQPTGRREPRHFDRIQPERFRLGNESMSYTQVLACAPPPAARLGERR